MSAPRIRVHPLTVVLCFAWAFSGGLADFLTMAIIVLLHEGAHCVTARLLGVPVYSITLYPFGGTAELGDMPPAAEAVIAAVGPLFTGTFAFLWKRIPFFPSWPLLQEYSVAVAFFNLLPVLPLDGGRFWKGLLRRWGKREVWLARLGALTGLCLTGWSVFRFFRGNSAGFSVLGVFLFVSALRESRRACMPDPLRRERERQKAREAGVLIAHSSDSAAGTLARLRGDKFWYILVRDEKENDLALLSEKVVADRVIQEDISFLGQCCPAGTEAPKSLLYPAMR